MIYYIGGGGFGINHCCTFTAVNSLICLGKSFTTLLSVEIKQKGAGGE